MSEELEIWAVVYGNYEPPEIDSLWFSREEAEQHADEMEGDWRVYSMTVQGKNRIEDALIAERDAFKEQLELVNYGLIACMLFLEEETVKGNSDAEIFLAGLTEKNIKVERDALQAKLDTAKEGIAHSIVTLEGNYEEIVVPNVKIDLLELLEKIR